MLIHSDCIDSIRITVSMCSNKEFINDSQSIQNYRSQANSKKQTNKRKNNGYTLDDTSKLFQ